MIFENKSVAEIVATYGMWPGCVAFLHPKNVLELGTGQGASAAKVMSMLPSNAVFTTINYTYPDNAIFAEFLQPWRDDPRLKVVVADTLEPKTMLHVLDDVDLMFLDTTHEAWHAASEMRMWQHKLQDGAIVVVDDLNQHDMGAFWDSLPYEKVPLSSGSYQGMFRYNALRKYEGTFTRLSPTTYGGGA